jgi:hypothetical protein
MTTNNNTNATFNPQAVRAGKVLEACEDLGPCLSMLRDALEDVDTHRATLICLDLESRLRDVRMTLG